MTIRFLLIIAALVCFIIAAVLGFGWFGTNATLSDVLGLTNIGLALWAGSTVAPTGPIT